MGNSCTKPDLYSNHDNSLPVKQVPRSAVLITTSSSIPSKPKKAMHEIMIPSVPQGSSDEAVNVVSLDSKDAAAAVSPSPKDVVSDGAAATVNIAAHDRFIRARDPSKPVCAEGIEVSPDSDYEKAREELARREAVLAFDYPTTAAATPLELRASGIVKAVRSRDDISVYGNASPRVGFGGHCHNRYAGDHFLGNVDLIPQTGLFEIAHRMPKGAHLHIHFNACLLPTVLLGQAAKMDRMYLTSDKALVVDEEKGTRADVWRSAMIEFSILPPGKESERPGKESEKPDKESEGSDESEEPGNIFHNSYEKRHPVKFSDFLAKFPEKKLGVSAMDWLASKIVFEEDEAHSLLQTSVSIWQRFDGRTRMMKGLFNYASAYEIYIKYLLADFARDNVQYAEVRPNFMKTNQLWTDDGTATIDNVGIMEIITSATKTYLRENPKSPFRGLKIIYCTPRILDAANANHAWKECIEFKKRWPEWIAGFDLIGEEAAGRTLHYFAPELLKFRKECIVNNLDIPLLLHCGESVDAGSNADGNVLDALLLGAKRIGHGFALPRHPYVMEQMKARGVCLELCPISNEILNLTPRVSGHAMYSLLANNVHCTVSSDNGTLFRSSLSHDFYQTMVGKKDMTLLGWKQLVLWSLEHSCLSPAERRDILSWWEAQWDEFVRWIVEAFDDLGNKKVPKA